MIVRFHPGAELDVLGARRWYRRISARLEQRFVLSLSEKLLDLEEWPDANECVHRDVHRARLRRFPYYVVYCVRDDVLVILALPHVARHPAEWIRRRP